jgi:hypothetical protein
VTGADSVAQRNGKLHIHTQCGPLTETIPLAYSEDHMNQRTPLDVRYVAEGNAYRFEWTKPAADNVQRIVIDPQLVVATFVVANGFSNNANPMITGYGTDYYPDGRFIGTSNKTGMGLFFPVSTGAYNASLAQYSAAGISCLNALGTSLIWSTVITNQSNEIPQPLATIINDNGLYICLGSQQSPVASETSLSLAQTLPALVNNVDDQLSYLYVLRLNHDGNQLLSSRCVGTAYLEMPNTLQGPRNSRGSMGLDKR